LDGWIALFDADQQRQGGRLDRDRVCECVTSVSIGRKEEALLYCNCSNETYAPYATRHDGTRRVTRVGGRKGVVPVSARTRHTQHPKCFLDSCIVVDSTDIAAVTLCKETKILSQRAAAKMRSDDPNAMPLNPKWGFIQSGV
jgi:hypothetical protein